MSVSAIFGTRMAAMPSTNIRAAPPIRIGSAGVNGTVIECSSRPQKKATAHHKKTRPRKTQAWDIRRGPTVYPPLPSLPPEWTLVTDASAAGAAAADDASAEQSAEA